MSHQLAHDLNRECHCISVDRVALDSAFRNVVAAAGLPAEYFDASRILFADSPVFLSESHVQAMADVVRAVEAIVGNSRYRQIALARLPEGVPAEDGVQGVLTSYDFHLDDNGPQLIEINTNAGGVLLSHYLASAQRACCPAVAQAMIGGHQLAGSEARLVDMFEQEWRRSRMGRPLRTIAIVDEEPQSQFLYPEFLLYQCLFTRHGIRTVIADVGDLEIRRGLLHAGDTPVDLVYNRLTDFYLGGNQSATLLTAYREGLAVVTPSPQVYALRADKRNLMLLSDSQFLGELGIAPGVIDTLADALPATMLVTPANAERLWAERKRYFFKPATGYGSRGAYRGAGLTRRVWQEIIAGEYIAQGLVSPTRRQILVDGEPRSLKVDLRCVAYNGEIQQVSARLYQGQTTNLRTAGGGLATVFAVPEEQGAGGACGARGWSAG